MSVLTHNQMTDQMTVKVRAKPHLRKALFPPAEQQIAVILGASLLRGAFPEETAGLSLREELDLKVLATRWFPAWEKFGPAQERYREAFDGELSGWPQDRDSHGPWTVRELTTFHGSMCHVVACAKRVRVPIEEAWFTPPFVFEGHTNEGMHAYGCASSIVKALVNMAQAGLHRWTDQPHVPKLESY